MKRNKKAISLILMALLMLFTFVIGCNRSAVEPEKTFDEFAEEIFVDWVSQSTLNVNFTIKHPEKYGLENTPIRWGTDLEDNTKEIEENKALLEELESFDYETLSPSQKYTYDI